MNVDDFRCPVVWFWRVVVFDALNAVMCDFRHYEKKQEIDEYVKSKFKGVGKRYSIQKCASYE